MKIALFVVIALLVVFFIGRYSRNQEVRNLKQDLQWYSAKYLYKTGATVLVPNANPYRLFSMDGGMMWYALDDQDKILGLAEEVHPGLLEHLDDFAKLTRYVEAHGPIDPTKPEDLKVLLDAGFQVQGLK